MMMMMMMRSAAFFFSFELSFRVTVARSVEFSSFLEKSALREFFINFLLENPFIIAHTKRTNSEEKEELQKRVLFGFLGKLRAQCFYFILMTLNWFF